MTTRELTPAQTAEALEVLRKIINRFYWVVYDHNRMTSFCVYCKADEQDGPIVHTHDCPITTATTLLAAVDSAQEAD